MKRLNLMTQFTVVIVLVHSLLVSGCATHSSQLLKQSQREANDQAVIEKVSTELQNLETRIAKAQSNDVALFSPDDMDSALGALAEARSYYERFQFEPQNVNKSISLFFGDTMGDKALSLIAKANAALNRAEENKRQADIIFAEAKENFEWLKKFQAPAYFRYEYQDIQRAYKGLIAAVSRGRIDAARRNLPQLLKEQRALEVVSAQRYYLDAISKRIEREGRYELDRYAAISYGHSLKALNYAKLVIAEDPRNEEAILAAKNQVEFSFEMAHAVAGDMKQLTNMDREDLERWLLLLTARLSEAGQYIGAQDVRNHSVLKQIELISEVAKQQGLANKTVPVELDSETVAEALVSDDPVVNRMNQLEQSLGRQIQLLTQQINQLKAENKRVSTQRYQQDSYVPLSERKSLFSY